MKLWVILLLLSGCSLFFDGREAPKTAKGSRYSVHFSMPNWAPKQDKRSDYVFENTGDGRILLSNSFCDEFQEQPLDRLAKKTFETVKDFKSDTESYAAFHDREAYRLEGAGLVDGVKVNFRLLNTRRDNCYFDFLAISPEGTPRDGAFDEFLKAVVFK